MDAVLRVHIQSPAFGRKCFLSSSVRLVAQASCSVRYALACRAISASTLDSLRRDKLKHIGHYRTPALTPLKANYLEGAGDAAGLAAGVGGALTVGAGFSILVVAEATANHWPLRRA